MEGISTFPLIVAVVAAVVGAATDLWKFRVYNALTVPLMISGLAYHGLTGGREALLSSSLGLLLGFGILIVPYLLGLMGAGDVKLLAGLGAWIGLANTLVVFIASSLVAGVVAVGLILYRGELKDSWATIKVIGYRFIAFGTHFGKEDLVENLSVSPDRRMRVIPFGAMIPLGMAVAYGWLQWKKQTG